MGGARWSPPPLKLLGLAALGANAKRLAVLAEKFESARRQRSAT
jgi:hypothetical protein